MTTLNKPLDRSKFESGILPIRILQFGEGNFLRAFVDWFVHRMNTEHEYDSGIAVVQPIESGMVELLGEQDGCYHHLIQGIDKGQVVNEAMLNTSIQRAINPFKELSDFFALSASPEVKLIFSNTTEAGIVFEQEEQPMNGLANTFPGKLVQLLQHRYESLGDTDESDLGIIPCELIEANGDKLKECIDEYVQNWDLDMGFQNWLNQRVHFANTLVDRIVPGYPKDEIGEILERVKFDDRLVVKSESFHLFVIEGDDFIQEHFPAHRYGFNVKYVDSIVPFRTQKVRILNGAHTSMVPVGLLAGLETVMETVEDEKVGTFVSRMIFEEIVPTISIPGEHPKDFAEQVLARFRNPFIRHELMSIALNSVAKWKVRVLPTLLDFFDRKGTLPRRLAFSLAALIQLHLSGKFDLKDDQPVLDFFKQLRATQPTASQVSERVLGNTSLWGMNLLEVEGFSERVAADLTALSEKNLLNALPS